MITEIEPAHIQPVGADVCVWRRWGQELLVIEIQQTRIEQRNGRQMYRLRVSCAGESTTTDTILTAGGLAMYLAAWLDWQSREVAVVDWPRQVRLTTEALS